MRVRILTLAHGPWRLADLKKVPNNGKKVFSCFHCGGGSTMGYKLAGFEVLGGVELDPQMMELYRANHKPKHSFLMGVQQFVKLQEEEIPADLFDLDILDGSPPCSAFSTAGQREKKWGSEHFFREGQEVQRLDNLFFDFIDVAKKLQPKVVSAENVRGLLIGKAKGYVKEIFREFDRAGYETQLFLLNAAAMGVPQMRERCFFVARRKDLGLSPLRLDFKEKSISVSLALSGLEVPESEKAYLGKGSKAYLYWHRTPPGKSLSFVHPKGSLFNQCRLHPGRPSNTMTAQPDKLYHWSECRQIATRELVRIQTFPEDYNFLKTNPGYVMGMSVPPFMVQRLSLQILRQWLTKT